MKTNISNKLRSQGSVLVVTMSIVAVAAIVLASYLMMVQNQSSSVARSQAWNALLPVSEAGIEEGLALVNQGAPNIIVSPMDWTNGVTSNGWGGFSNSQTTLTRTVSGSNYFVVTVDISGSSPTIFSSAVIPYTSIPWVFSSAQRPFIAAAGFSLGNSGTNMGRKVQVQTVLNPLFSAAIITKSNFNMNGNDTTVDSFDSSTPLYSTAGQYDASKRLATGDVDTDSSIVGDVSVGNGNIYGHVKTGPGTVQSAVQIGPNGSVGATGASGIQAGYWSGDFNVSIPDITNPPSGISPLPLVSNIVQLAGGNYAVGTGDPGLGKPFNVTATTTVWVQGSFSPVGVTITNNAKLILYVGRLTGSGDSLTLGGNQTINQPGYADNLQVYGLPSLTSLSMHGNAGFIGGIYAPEANATFGGGGNNTTDTSGAIIVNSLTLSGHWNFHYDQSLKTNGPARGWVATNWTEVKFP